MRVRTSILAFLVVESRASMADADVREAFGHCSLVLVLLLYRCWSRDRAWWYLCALKRVQKGVWDA